MEKQTINTNEERHGTEQMYGRVIILSLVFHIIFTLIFSILHLLPLVIYNVCSVLFYIIIFYLAGKGCFRTVIALIHPEVCLFVIVTCLFVGWEPGFSFYLIVMTTFVYFRPFKNKFIPYLFSIMEFIIFLSLKLYTLYHPPLIPDMGSHIITGFYIFNTFSAFAAIIYVALITNVTAASTEQRLLQKNTRLQDMVNHDALTRLWSRSYLSEKFNQTRSQSMDISIVMTDIDDFKAINDTYGHNCGDYILSELAALMRDFCTENCGICRWGGEEFVLMFYEYSLDEVIDRLQQIRQKIALHPFTYQSRKLYVTMTFGVSSLAEAPSLKDLIRLADDRMYQGKSGGKNVVITPYH